MTEERGHPTWAEVAWLSAVALIGIPLTYAVFYADRVWSAHSSGEPLARTVPEVFLLALSVGLGGLLAAGLRWPGLLRAGGLVSGFLVFGHIVWGAVAIDVSAAFVLSNWCEMAVSLFLVHAASEAEKERADE